MRSLPFARRTAPVLLAALLAPAVLAQPERDEAGIANGFAEVLALAQADSVAAALQRMACPVAGPDGRPVAGRCDPDDAEHRARAEWQLALLRRLFPMAPTALRPTYAVEREGGADFHLLLFQDLPEAPYALVSFIDLEGEPLFGEVQVDDLPEGIPPPASLVAALDRLLDAAADPDTTPETFAPLLVKTDGPDAWTASADASDPEDQALVGSTLARLRALLAETDGYKAAGFDTDRESEGTWHVLTVQMAGAEGPVYLAFLPVGGTFLLGDIDG
ncbi:MAG: hypothetical protein R3181_02835 [Rubricoccaceae bacterium]|nr:hypothetical protein [Rubricoccaceae bacterium]